MSEGASPRPLGDRLLEALVVLVLLALLVAGRNLFPVLGAGAGTIASVGILLMGGTVLANLLELVGLPHLTGYLLAGVATGPYVLGLVSHHAVEDLLPVNQLALSLIALAGGAELRISSLKSGFRSLAWATLCTASRPAGSSASCSRPERAPTRTSTIRPAR